MYPQQTRQARSYSYPEEQQYGAQTVPMGSPEQPAGPTQQMQPMGAQQPMPQQGMPQQGMGGQQPMPQQGMGGQQQPMGGQQQPAPMPTETGPLGMDQSHWMQMGAGIGGLLGGLGWKNPADAAQGYLSQISDILGPYFDPYIKAGKLALPFYEKQSIEGARDPSKLMSQMGAGFQQDPGYQYDVSQATSAANQAAAAGGMAGSPAEQQQLSQNIMGMANKDYYNYLNHVMGLYSQGMGGLSDINKLGYQASKSMGTDLGDVALSQAKMAYLSQALSNMHRASGGVGIGGLTGGIISKL